MGRDRTQQATPDLFSTAPFGETTPPATKGASSEQERRHVLCARSSQCLNDQRQAAQLIAGAAVQPNAVPSFRDAEAIVLDLVQPRLGVAGAASVSRQGETKPSGRGVVPPA
jgi:hypothetical protein